MPLLILYSTPTWVVKTIVPVRTAQVGCIVDATVGTAGGAGATIVTVDDAGVKQVLSSILRTTKLYIPGATPENVSLV